MIQCGSFLQEVLQKKLPYTNIDYTDYVVHFGNGSWKKNANTTLQTGNFEISKLTDSQWLCKYKNLFMT